MAQLSLNRAKQISNRIKAETAFGVEEDDAYAGYGRRRRTSPAQRNSITLNGSFSVDGPVGQQAEAYRRAAIGKVDKMFALMEIGTKLRVEMAIKNAECGVTQLVTRRVMVDQKIRILDHILQQIETDVLNTDLLIKQAEAIKGRLASATSNATTAQVATNVLTHEDRNNYTDCLTELRSELMMIDDTLGRHNATNEITIDDDDLAKLRAYGLAA